MTQAAFQDRLDEISRARRQGLHEETTLWKYNTQTGYWDFPRSMASPRDEPAWLKTFHEDAPTEHFVLSKTRPSTTPTTR